jgi:CubicO group peptidase (beta-lactamase class C family)
MQQKVRRDFLHGEITSGFEPVADALAKFCAAESTYAAQLSIYYKGQQVVDLWGGDGISGDSITGVFSATKGVGGICIAVLVERGLLNLDAPVATYWPEFGTGTKENVTVRQLLSHQAGLLGIPGGFDLAELVDSSKAAAKLALQIPAWRSGASHGYHAFTIGIFMDELVRRVVGESLQSFYERTIRAPREIDFYLGLPESEEKRYVEVRVAPEMNNYAAMEHPDSDSLEIFAFNSRERLEDAQGRLLPNNPEIRRSGNTSIGGIGSARGLARLYSATLDAVGGPRLFGDKTLGEVSQIQSAGVDLVLGVEKRFGIVFLKSSPAMPFGSHTAFGHDGAGGEIGFADPLYSMGFGYTVWPMTFPGGVDPRASALSRIARDCISRTR